MVPGMDVGQLTRALGREVTRLEPVAGGDLNDAYAATLATASVSS